MLTVKIYTCSKKVLEWKSLPAKIAAIEGVLNTAKNANFKVSIEYKKLKPEVVDGRVTHAYMDTLRKRDLSDFILLHFTEQYRDLFKIKPTLRGSRHNDDDDVGEMYFWADENTRRGRYNQFIETCLHEIRHELCAGIGIYDDTHNIHGTNNTLREAFTDLDIEKYRPTRQSTKTLLRKVLYAIINKLTPTKPTTLHNRLPADYNEKISQEYGVQNTAYALTGRHIGIDYACPIGTPVFAPWEGKVTVTGEHGTLGKFCYFEYEFEGKKRVERLLHLNTIPMAGSYSRGDVIAYSGNTGFSTGPHLHVDGWWDEVNIGSINKTNWDTLTYNPKINTVQPSSTA